MLPAKHVICTLFDHRYLSRGLCMIGSARRHGFTQDIWVLCLSEECRQTLAALALPGVYTITLDQLEAHIPRLIAARADRGILEYYFTCMAALHTYLFDALPDIDGTMYVDADIQFFASPEVVFDAIGDAPAAVTPHNFPPGKNPDHEKFGAFNAGWTAFRRTPDGQKVLSWWLERSLEWCRNYVDGYRYANQGYLTRFHEIAPNTKVLNQKGFNCAPWNIPMYDVTERDGCIFVDDEPMVFFHFHGLTRRFGFFYISGHRQYGTPLSWSVRKKLYRPYVAELERMERLQRSVAPAVKAEALPPVPPATAERATPLRRLDRLMRDIYRVLRNRPLVVLGTQVW